MGLLERVGLRQRGGRSVEANAMGVMPTHVDHVTMDNRQMMEQFKKDMSGGSGGLFGGWTGSSTNGYSNVNRAGPARLGKLAASYGGTTDSVTWVFACVSLIAATAAAYPWRFVDAEEDTVETPPPDLVALLERPNDEWTYFDLIEAVGTDLELVGNSYLLKDQTNGLGQPKQLLRLLPDRMRIAVNGDGSIRGYVYTPAGANGIQIPFDVAEIIHFKYPNPMDPYYGMGTVEALSPALDRSIAQSGHITGYFQNGARISGVLTVSGTMSDTQFERLKQSYSEQFAGSASAYKMLIAEGGQDGGVDYKPITEGPAASGIVDLMDLAKDEILGGFGIPAPLLGGLMENANYKMEDSQQIFLRAMIPKSRRIAERLTHDLVSLWGPISFRMDPHANEPMSVRIGYAKEMIGAGATLNEAREAMGLPLSDDEAADQILLPNTLIPLGLVGKQPVPPASLPAAAPEPAAAPASLSDHLNDLPAQVATGKYADAVATLERVRAELRAIQSEPESGRSSHKVKAALPESADDDEHHPALTASPRPRSARVAMAELSTTVGPPRRKASFNGPDDAWVPPDLPAGYEQITHARTGDARLMRASQARALRVGVDVFRPVFRKFFREQRDRVLDELSAYGSRSARMRRRPTKAKDDLTPDALFDPNAENAALTQAYTPALHVVMKAAAASIPATLGGGLDFDLSNPAIDDIQGALASKVVGINATTQNAISSTVEEGMRRGYSIPQIANGYPDEEYPGIMGVFDAADDARAETIARTETAYAYNGMQIASYQAAGFSHVEILDGTNFDEACASADGQVWTLEQYQAAPIEHPNCSRTGVPVDAPDDGEPKSVKTGNPNHDPSNGEFSSGDGSSDADASPASNVGAPGAGSSYSDDQVAQVHQAVSDAIARHPELSSGAAPLLSVGYTSQADAPPGISQSAWDAVQPMGDDGTTATTLRIDEQPGFPQTGEITVMNDKVPFNPTPDAAPSSMSAYGTTTHEMGHALFQSVGVIDDENAQAEFDKVGITAADVAGVSNYAASQPTEALGEMYSMQNTPGFSLPEALGEKFSQLETNVGIKK